MYLHSIASAFPKYELTQAETWQSISQTDRFADLTKRSQQILEKVFLGNSGIETRRFAVDDPFAVTDLGPGELNRLFEQEAPAMARSALAEALEKAETTAAEIDAFFLCTCTGYLCPGVTSYVAETMGMRNDVFLQDIVGLGCGAALPTLRSASGFFAENPDATVAMVAVESCSSAYYVADDVGVLISLCLFGDAASASIWQSTPGESGYRVGRHDTRHIPEEREKIRFVNDAGKLRNKLHRTVPEMAAQAVDELYGLRTQSAPKVLTHTGGRDVLDAIEAKCGLDTITESREVLRRYGNTSSPSVLLALESYLEGGDQSDRSDHLWLTSFGAGFACHSMEMER